MNASVTGAGLTEPVRKGTVERGEEIDEAGGPSRQARRGAALLVACWALVTAAALGLRSLLPIDETRVAAVAWEMWQRGDLLVPHLNGLPYSGKPPLLLWLIDLGWWIFGVNELWPRLLAPLCALGTLGLTARLARRLWPERESVRRAAPWVLAGFLLWAVFTTFLLYDNLLALLTAVALLGLEAARRGGRRGGFWVAGAAVGLGLLTKGPVALLAPAAVALAAPWWGKDGRIRGARWALGLIAALALAVAVALAWALPAAAAGGRAYAQAIFLSQTRDRLVESFAHERPWWWYAALLPGLLFPYSLWLPLFAGAGRIARGLREPGVRFALAALLPPLALFFLVSGKQPYYLVPLLPAAALLAARGLGGVESVRRRHLVLPFLGLLLVAAALALAPLAAARDDAARWVGGVPPWLGPLLAALGALILWRFRALAAWAGTVAAPLTLLSLLIVVVALGAFTRVAGPAYDPRLVAHYLHAAERQGRPLAFAGEYNGEFHFAGRLMRPLERIHPATVATWLAAHPAGRVVQYDRRRPGDLTGAELVAPFRSGSVVIWSLTGRRQRWSLQTSGLP